MFGDKGDRKKREPKEVKISDRKLVGSTNINDRDKKNSSNNNQNNSNSSHTSTSNNTQSSNNNNSLGDNLLPLATAGLGALASSVLQANNKKGTKKNGCSGCGCLILIISIFLIGIFFLFIYNSDSSSNNVSVIEDGIKTNTSNEKGYNWLLRDNESHNKKPYTVMIYMNGSDLESKYGLATGDIAEMLRSKHNEDNLNIILITGGTKKWKAEGFSKNLTIYEIGTDNIKKIADLGMNTFGDTELLSKYIDYSMQVYPADKYGFIFWDHGGGTLYGYGSDENYDGKGLSISEIGTAFKNSNIGNKGFEFIGYDCCLMATIETAKIMAPYANYFIASAETEPGTGWDYEFFKTLGNNPNYSGLDVGKDIVDSFIKSNERQSAEATLSIMDLEKIDILSQNFDNFAELSQNAIKNGDFNTISRARKNTKAFGYYSEDQSFDLVDIKHLAENLYDFFPNEAKKVIESVDECIVYNRSTSVVKNSNGVTTYIPYVSKDLAKQSVNSYKNLNLFPKFTNFLISFSEKLTGSKISRTTVEKAIPEIDTSGNVVIKIDPNIIDEINQIQFVIWRQLEPDSDYFIRLGIDPDVEILKDGTIAKDFDGYWATLNGETACFYVTEQFDGVTKYVVPAILNGIDVNIIIIYDGELKVLGAMEINTNTLAPKYMIPINDGDKITLKYFAQLFLKANQDESMYTEKEKWIKGSEFTVKDGIKVDIVPVGDEVYLYGFCIEDTQKNIYFTDFIKITY